MLAVLEAFVFFSPVLDDVVDEGALANVSCPEDVDVAVTPQRLLSRLRGKGAHQTKRNRESVKQGEGIHCARLCKKHSSVSMGQRNRAQERRLFPACSVAVRKSKRETSYSLRGFTNVATEDHPPKLGRSGLKGKVTIPSDYKQHR